MGTGEKRRARYRWVSAILISLFVTAATELPKAYSQLARKRRARGDESSAGPRKPELLNAETNPTLRFPIASFSGWSIFSTSYGWLDVSRKMLHYTVEQPAGKLREGFEVPLDDIAEVKFQYGYLRFRASGKHRTIFYLPPERWGSIHSGPGALQASADGMGSTMAIQQAIKDFDTMLATVKPKPEPLPPPPVTPSSPPPQPPVPPVVVLVEPSVPTSGQVIEVSNPSITLRGVATDQSGLPLVTINGTPANMKPRSSQAVEFWSDAISLQPGETKIEITASNAAHAQSNFSFTVRLNSPPLPPPKVWKPTSPNPVPLAKLEILQMLKSMPSAQVKALVNENGINFAPSADDLKEISEAGGGDDLIEAIKQAATPTSR